MSNCAVRSIFRSLIAVAVGVICTAALTIALTIWWLHAEAIADAFRDSSNLAEVLAGQTASSIQSIDLILTEIKVEEELRSTQGSDDLDRVGRGEATYQYLVERLSHLPQADFITLVDKNGKLVNTTLQRPAPDIDLSDRAYFQHFKNHDDKGIYISNALINRIAGTRFASFSRRINDANNAFLGVVIVGVRLAYFQKSYESVASLPDQSFLLLHRDGTVIVRYPDSPNLVSDKMPADSPWHRLVAQGGGNYRSSGYVDGAVRLAAVRPLRDYPLVVNVGVSEAAALVTWRIQAIAIGAGTLLFVCCSLFLLRALSRQFHSLEKSEVALVKKTGELQRAKATVDAALNNLVQGVVMFDANALLIVCNQRYLDMYGLSRDVVRPGSALQKIVEHRAAVGSFGTEDVGQYIADILAAIGQGTAFSRMTNLRDGRIIHVVSQPIEGGGWVTTHEDVTEAKCAEERISHLAHHDALTGLPNRKLFYLQLEQALKRVRRGERLAVLYLDVDHLKRINDTLGHSAGDKLLKAVAGMSTWSPVSAATNLPSFSRRSIKNQMPPCSPCGSATRFTSRSISTAIKWSSMSASAFPSRWTMPASSTSC
jgi:PAS domain-containing protein